MLLPQLARQVNYQQLTTTRLVQHVLPPEKVTIAVDGSVRSATVAMAFNNYADVFPGEIVSTTRGPKAETFEPDCDVFVFIRSFEAPEPGRRQEADDLQIPIIYALDDDLLRLFSRKEENAGKVAAIEQHLGEADFIIAYSRALVAEIEKRNPRVTTLWMNMPARFLDRPAARPAADGMARYLIIGRVIRSHELRTMADELRAFFAEHASEAKLTVFASDRLEPDYRRLLDGVDFDVTPTLKYLEFRAFLTRSDFDFVINPLLDTPFNRGKSPVKYFESAIAGAVLITSDMPVYKAVRHDETGIVVPWKEGAWRAGLEHSLALSAEGRQRLHAGAVQHLREAFTTEANYLPFRTAIEAARLHVVLGGRTEGDGETAILVDDPDDAGLIDAIRQCLGPSGFRVVDAASLGKPPLDPAAGAALLRGAHIRLVHAANPGSPWLAAADVASLPCVAGWTMTADHAEHVDLVLAETAAEMIEARAAGFAAALRWTPPPPDSRRGLASKPLKANKDGVRIVASRGAAPAWIAPMLQRLHDSDTAIRFEVACPDAERAEWDAAFAPYSETIPVTVGVTTPPEHRGVVVIVGVGGLKAALEAMSTGIPVIAVAAPDLEEFIADGLSGRIVAADPGAVARAIEEVFALEPDALARLRECAASAAAILAGPAIAAANLLRFYRLAALARQQRQGRPAAV